MASNSVVLELPECPSANRWWRRAGSHMHLSHEAKAYKADVAQRLGINGTPVFPTEALTIIVVWRRQRKSGDLDKRLGVLLDSLQGSVYQTDAQIVQIWARRCDEHPIVAAGMMHIEVFANESAPQPI